MNNRNYKDTYNSWQTDPVNEPISFEEQLNDELIGISKKRIFDVSNDVSTQIIAISNSSFEERKRKYIKNLSEEKYLFMMSSTDFTKISRELENNGFSFNEIEKIIGGIKKSQAMKKK